jgi:deazaflavin-dependent oxidoreductase (nitroreductase family)
MAKEMQINGWVRFLNRMTAWAVKRGLTKKQALLTTLGRKSGELRSTPVTPMQKDGRTWVVSPYGNVGWVYNVRHSGRLTLRRGSISQNHQVTELIPDEAAPVLKRYLEEVKIVRPYFDVTVDSSLEDIAEEAARHPVFRLEHVH